MLFLALSIRKDFSHPRSITLSAKKGMTHSLYILRYTRKKGARSLRPVGLRKLISKELVCGYPATPGLSKSIYTTQRAITITLIVIRKLL
jgi:hypothetical protein